MRVEIIQERKPENYSRVKKQWFLDTHTGTVSGTGSERQSQRQRNTEIENEKEASVKGLIQ